MGLFPTRILLAADGSEEAELAALRAVDLAECNRLRVARGARRSSTQLPEELIPEPADTMASSTMRVEEESRELLRKLSWRVKVAGGAVAGSHLRMGAVDLGIGKLGQGARGGPDRDGMSGPPEDKEGHRGEYLRCGYPPRSLPM